MTLLETEVWLFALTNIKSTGANARIGFIGDDIVTSTWLARASKLNLSVDDVVDGKCERRTGRKFFQKYGPRDGKLLYQFAATDSAEVEQAVRAARRAFCDGHWQHMPLQRRKLILLELAALIERHKEELALLECLDVGKPIRDALTIDIPMALSILRFNAEALEKVHSKVYAADANNLSYQLRRPVGVVAAIVGWNFPLVLAMQKIAPALMAGNSMILKPSEVTSLSTWRVAQLAMEAGIPEGVLNVVHGGAAVGDILARHMDIDLLTFTGSSGTGRAMLMAAGQSNMKRLILECGGKAPSIVFEDCPNMEIAVNSMITRAFWNQGQVCTAESRLLVQQSVEAPLLRLLLERVRELRFGDPLDPSATFGPVVSKAHRERVLGYIKAAQEEGAVLIHQTAGSPPFAEGFYVPPTVFHKVQAMYRVAQEEVFGPVLSVLSFQDEAEAVEIANGTIYGLSATVWTKDLGRAHRMAQRLCAGAIAINATASPGSGPADGSIPVAGLKQSGIGIEGGLEGLEAYTNQSAVQIFV